MWFWTVRSDPDEEQAALQTVQAKEAQEAGGPWRGFPPQPLPGTRASRCSEDGVSAGEMGLAGGVGVTLAPYLLPQASVYPSVKWDLSPL